MDLIETRCQYNRKKSAENRENSRAIVNATWNGVFFINLHD